METYAEMKARHQREFNALPIGAAFSKDQFERMMREWGLPVDAVDQIYSLGYGAYIQRKDADLIHQTAERIEKEEKDAIAADETGLGFIKEMFYRELCDHECFYTNDISEMLDALEITREQLNADPRLKAGLQAAWNEGREKGL